MGFSNSQISSDFISPSLKKKSLIIRESGLILNMKRMLEITNRKRNIAQK